jgi:hypothetical protein
MKAYGAVLGVALMATATVGVADTLVLVDGRRVQGELIGVVGSEIQFEERSGSGRRTLRIPRYEIVRIEFDNPGRGPSGPTDGTPAIPRGLRERRVAVSARDAWTDTRIDLRPGQPVYFSASGQVRWGPNRRDGAAGERNSPFNAGRPLPDRPAAALIGRIGEGEDYFFIGADPGPFRIPSGGRLYLGINDDYLPDNSGTLTVTVSY